MSRETEAQKRIIVARFKDLDIWSVSAQFAASWKWPKEYIKPLSTALSRRCEPAMDSLEAEELVSLLTIRFDGSIESREPIRIKDVKGKLFRIYPGDVVFSKIDVRNGAIGLAPNDIDRMCATSEFPVYSVDEGRVVPEYVKLLFRTSSFKRILNSMISGASGRKRIQPTQLEGVKVPVPPLSVQHKISNFWAEVQDEYLAAKNSLDDLVRDLNRLLIGETHSYELVTRSRVFVANYANAKQWDLKAGRAGAFIAANPNFVRLGDFTEECTDTVKPWKVDNKTWPIYGVNNKDGVFLSSNQDGSDFNSPYKRISENCFFHNPTRANVGSLGIVPKVPEDALTSPEYQVWRLKDGFHPEFMALLLKTEYFLKLVSFNRVGGVKQRMYYANLAEIRLPMISMKIQRKFGKNRLGILNRIKAAESEMVRRKNEIEQMILGFKAV